MGSHGQTIGGVAATELDRAKPRGRFPPIYTYRVISEVASVPDMTHLEAGYAEEPSSRGDVFHTTFSTGYTQNPAPYEPAVGARCRVIRMRDGESQECSGAVERVTPYVRVALDGEGWR